MAKNYVMALDAGTTSNRAIIFDKNSKIVGVSQKEFTQYFPEPGWVEHDADEIWSSMTTVMKEALEQSGLVASVCTMLSFGSPARRLPLLKT